MVSNLKIESAILSLIAQRGAQSSACPSEVARALAPDEWRELMPHVRSVAWSLRAQGLLDITQRGVPVLKMDEVRGPIRIRQPTAPAESFPIGETP